MYLIIKNTKFYFTLDSIFACFMFLKILTKDKDTHKEKLIIVKHGPSRNKTPLQKNCKLHKYVKANRVTHKKLFLQ